MFIIGKLKRYDKVFPAIGQEKKSPKLTNLWLLKSYRGQDGENGHLVCKTFGKNSHKCLSHKRISAKEGDFKNGQKCAKMRTNAHVLSKNEQKWALFEQKLTTH